jgi:hypothetical protein
MQMNDKIILGPDSKLHNNERSYHTIPTLEIIFGINLINLEGKNYPGLCKCITYYLLCLLFSSSHLYRVVVHLMLHYRYNHP